MCSDLTTPSYLAVSGWLAAGQWPGGCGERGTWAAVSIIPLGSCSGGGLARKDCCCGWLLLDLLAISRTLCSAAVSGVCCRLCRKKKKGHGKKWPGTLRTPPGQLARRACPAGAAQEEHLLLLRNDRCRTGAGHMYVLEKRDLRACGTPLLLDCIILNLREPVYTWSQNVPYFLWPAGWGGAEKRGTGAATTMPSIRSCSDLDVPMDRDYPGCFARLALWPTW